MSDKEINIAIAKACPDKFRYENGAWFFQYAINCWMQCHYNSICRDLNAMHKAVNYGIANGLIEASVYRTYLADVEDEFWNTTARQRAEVFLRVLGKWKEEAK